MTRVESECLKYKASKIKKHLQTVVLSIALLDLHYATRSPFFIVAALLSTPGNIFAGSLVTTRSMMVGQPLCLKPTDIALPISFGSSTRIPLQPKASAAFA